MDEKIILLFPTTHETLLAEKVLKENNIRVKPRIKPRVISSQCGIGLEADEGRLPSILSLCEKNRFSRPGVFKESEGKGWEKV
ncbi:MAG: DUF3343 domain-containing protein [Nitrospinae bacterium]|nr:DUF3343 domain-containing protein [Nitrospinota bacterium]